MAGSKYADAPSTIQLIGCIYKNPYLMDNEGEYFFSEEDFPNDFHRVVFGAAYNLWKMGAKNLSVKAVEDYLMTHPKEQGIYRAGNGPTWLKQAIAEADLSNFDYYYSRVKKMTLLREFSNIGVNVSDIFDADNLIDSEKKERQNKYLDKLTLNEIADLIEEKVNNIRREYVDNSTDEAVSAATGIDDLFESLSQKPDMGQPMYGNYINMITRGMRLGKFFLRSAASGVGKSRTMIADFCYCACSEIYENGQWISTGLAMPSVFISTELELDELQTMMVAFLSGIDEERILNNQVATWGDERDRINYAIELIKKSPMYIEIIPDFSLKDIENIIKRNIRLHACKYIFLDYIHTSMKILEEISRRSGGVRLREDNVLFLLSVKLKDICNQFGVFILSSTQLNQDWKSSDIPDQNLLRGAKSIADKIDVGMILLDVTKEDKEVLQKIIGEGRMPNVKLSVYKNRRGSYNKCYLWMTADKSTCRFNGLFCTDYNYELIQIKDINITMKN